MEHTDANNNFRREIMRYKSHSDTFQNVGLPNEIHENIFTEKSHKFIH